MKKNIYLLIYGISFVAGLLVLDACTEKSEVSQVTAATDNASGSSIFRKSTEEKVDEFLTDYLKDMKAALAEPDDKKAAAKIQQMKEEYAPRAEELKPEVEAWETSLSEEERKALEQRTENKPYIHDLMATSISAMSRMNKSPELRKALEALNADISFINEDLSSEEATGEEYPEDIAEDNVKK
jgi:hypothetical protein